MAIEKTNIATHESFFWDVQEVRPDQNFLKISVQSNFVTFPASQEKCIFKFYYRLVTKIFTLDSLEHRQTIILKIVITIEKEGVKGDNKINHKYRFTNIYIHTRFFQKWRKGHEKLMTKLTLENFSIINNRVLVLFRYLRLFEKRE